MKKFISVLIILLCAGSGFAQNAWINELHYDNGGTDVGEFVEVVIQDPGSWNLNLFQVDLYNGNGGTSYNSEIVANFTIGTTSGNYSFYYWDLPTNGIQNGAPDGLALSYNGAVIPGQFLSYEGTFTGVGGPADGMLSIDIGVQEVGTEPTGNSLQLGGTGTQYSDFTWNSPAPETKGALNIGQSLSSGSTSVINVTPALLSGFSYLEGGGPSASQSYELSGTNLEPSTGNIVVSGSADFEVSSDNVSFGASLNIPYSGGALAATNIYVRLKAGLTGGFYEGELITNEGGSAPAQSVLCSGAVVKGEPTNHVTGFTGVLGFPAYYYVDLSWTDATGAIVPDGYLIKRSTVDFNSITDPVDGVPETNSYSVQNAAQGVQAAEFTGFADTTYYFKIYPYTNDGPYIDYKTDGSVPQFTITSASAPSFPVIENFEYATGSFLTDDGWIAHSGTGTNPIYVNDTALTYTGYLNSGLGKSVTMTTTGEDVNRAFHTTTSGKIYASFMVNVSDAQANGDYFFNLGPENTTYLYFGRVYVKKAVDNSISFGLSKSSTNSTTLSGLYRFSLFAESNLSACPVI